MARAVIREKFDPPRVSDFELTQMRRDRMFDGTVGLVETTVGVVAILDGWGMFAQILLFTLGVCALAMMAVAHRRIRAVETLREALKGCDFTDCEED